MHPWGAREQPLWPRVSVVIPCLNRPHLLERAVRSVYGQDYPGEVECIVVLDDPKASAPRGPEKLHRSLITLRNERKQGLAGARNHGALVATGQLVAFLDDDDEWLPMKLRQQVEALHAHSEAAAAGCGIVVVYRKRQIERLTDELVTFDDLVRSRQMVVHSSTILVRREDLLGRIGLVSEEIPGGASEDYEWQLRAARQGPIIVVQRPLARIRWHEGSFYARNWETFVAGLHFVLEHNPEFHRDPRGLARILGQIAFAKAAGGKRKEAVIWARRCLAANWRQPRGYLALAVAARLVSAELILHRLHLHGRGV